MSDREIAHDQLERSYIKLVVGSGLGLLLFILLCWGGCHLYSDFQERHMVGRAVGFYSGGNFKDAALSARRALTLNPQNIEALRMMAQVAERTNDRSAIDWRRKVLEEKSSADDLIALAMTALQFKEIAIARDALAKLDGADQQTPRYFAAMARVAEAQQHKKEAEAYASRAVDLAPQDASFQLQLALLRLEAGDEAKRQAGRAILEKLRADPTHRLAATRALIIDGIAHHEIAVRLRDLAHDLQGFPEANFNDRLLYLDLLRQMNDADYVSYLTKMEEAAVANPADLASLFSWMNRSSLSTLALDFSRTRPPEELAKWPVPLALAESYSNLRDWSALERHTQNANWGAYEFLRHAFLARAYRGQRKDVQAAREWAAAQKDASAESPQLLLLARTTSEWEWDAETEDILWQLAKRPDAQSEALATLYRQYLRTSNTAGLYRVLLRLAELDPADQTIQNNLAQTSLLLNAEISKALKIAAELHRQDPANAAVTTTYAFALSKNGKLPQALEALQTVKEPEQADPSVSLYYGVILVAAGEAERARPFLERAASATSLLPEEKQLLKDAQARLTAP